MQTSSRRLDSTTRGLVTMAPRSKRSSTAAARAIARNPRLYPLVEDGIPGREIREYFIVRFSQRVIYVMNDDDVLVVAVIHSDAREGAWHENLPQTPPPETS